MKKLLLLPVIILSLLSCCTGNNPPEPPEPTQDYTSFVFEAEINGTYTNCKAGYFDENKKCKLLAEFGTMTKGIKTKEVKIPNEDITDIYFFLYNEYSEPRRLRAPFILEKKKKNVFELVPITVAIDVDVDDPYQYPH
ncbi:hypothetical protein D0T49_12145 [Paludibacter sp. 221]|uniref:hypothetical protein n=1 Tax=Paludibacter sp. 221 TaxID=2302939 RepID=UPI0013D4A163|nr:hypothetical protein [Paludibacter sp. 221]NDV47797.1 hypothetical protein [Paludibacter sp. 221]